MILSIVKLFSYLQEVHMQSCTRAGRQRGRHVKTLTKLKLSFTRGSFLPSPLKPGSSPLNLELNLKLDIELDLGQDQELDLEVSQEAQASEPLDDPNADHFLPCLSDICLVIYIQSRGLKTSKIQIATTSLRLNIVLMTKMTTMMLRKACR